MRRETRIQERISNMQTNVLQGYHQRTRGNLDTNYAFQGFEKNLYFTSDRTIDLDANFKRADDKPLKGFGPEIEVECNSINGDDKLATICKEIITKSLPNKLFKFQTDGSLSGRSSVEMITQVMTKEFIRNNYPNFKAMFDAMKWFDISASESGNCGMHINISNALFGSTNDKQIDSIRKLYYIINNYFNEMCAMLKRDRSRTGFCGKYRDYDLETCKTLDLTSFSTNHRVCLNLGHFTEGRIEIRLVGGQADYYAFRNTFETVFFLVDRLSKMSWSQIQTFGEIWIGCNQYVLKRLSDLIGLNLLTFEEFNRIKANSVEQDLEIR